MARHVLLCGGPADGQRLALEDDDGERVNIDRPGPGDDETQYGRYVLRTDQPPLSPASYEGAGVLWFFDWDGWLR